jgi:hypothetical protein
MKVTPRRWACRLVWMLAFGQHEDHMPAHGYELTREAANPIPVEMSSMNTMEFKSWDKLS